MRILSHRGYWRDVAEKNTPAAFKRSVDLGFGTETDIRDLAGALVVAHDPPVAGALPIDALLETFRGSGLSLAINVKADGIAPLIAEKLKAAGVDWFAFDMSGPETVRYLKLGLPTFTRHSDIEPQPICYADCQGVWLDAFQGPEWYDASVIGKHLENGKQVCVVSPELHGRSKDLIWAMLRDSPFVDNPGLMLCTDTPEDARTFFLGNLQ